MGRFERMVVRHRQEILDLIGRGGTGVENLPRLILVEVAEIIRSDCRLVDELLCDLQRERLIRITLIEVGELLLTDRPTDQNIPDFPL